MEVKSMKKFLSILFVGTLMFLCTAPIVNAATFWLVESQDTNVSGTVIGYEKYTSCINNRSSAYDVKAQAEYRYAFSWWNDVYYYVAPNAQNRNVKTSVKNTDTSWRLRLTSTGDKNCRAYGEIIYD